MGADSTTWTRPVVIAVTAAMLLLVAPVSGQGTAPLKVVVMHAGESALLIHLISELRAMGFAPVEIETENLGTSPEALAELAASYEAVGVMTVMGPGKEIEVWVSKTGEAADGERELIMAEQNRREALIALRAVELLRANLIAIRSRRHPPSPPPPPFASKPRTEETRTVSPEPSHRRWSLALQPAVTAGFGGLHPAFHIGVSTGIRMGRWMGLTFLGLAPTFPIVLRATEGKVDIRTGFAGVGMVLFLADSRRRWQPTLSAGVGPLLVSTRGHADPPYVGQRDLTVSALTEIDVGLSVRLYRFLSLRMDLLAGVAAPRSVIRLDEREGATYGRPFVAGMLGLEVWLR